MHKLEFYIKLTDDGYIVLLNGKQFVRPAWKGVKNSIWARIPRKGSKEIKITVEIENDKNPTPDRP